jgi:DNA polymerase-3 subunit epsilon
MQTISVIDCETTGLGKLDRIIEIAVVTLDAKTLVTIDEFDTLVNPQRDVGKTDVHGITASMVAAAPTMDEVIGALSRRLNGSVLAAHSLRFDSRMLGAECARVGAEYRPGRGICTLGLSGEKLPLAAKRHGIALQGHHRALVDARVAAELLRKLFEESDTEPAQLDTRGLPTSTRTHRRDVSASTEVTPLQRLVARACVPSSIGACLDYFEALDWVLDDGVITADERQYLNEVIGSSQLTDAQIKAIHESYLNSLVQAVTRDELVTKDEQKLIVKIAGVLGITDYELPKVSRQSTRATIKGGQRVCFTGSAVDSRGAAIDRADLECLAASAGLQPVKMVSKKSCDLLVAADTSSASGKAKRARQHGIPIISVQEFLSQIGA